MAYSGMSYGIYGSIYGGLAATKKKLVTTYTLLLYLLGRRVHTVVNRVIREKLTTSDWRCSY